MKQIPVRQQFSLMQLRPSLYQTPLLLRKGSGNHFHRINRKNSSFILKIRMEMSDMVRRSRFRKHSDNDTKEAAEFRHSISSYPHSYAP